MDLNAGSAVATRAECWLALATAVTTWPGLRLSCPAVLADSDIFSKALLQKIFLLLSCLCDWQLCGKSYIFSTALARAEPYSTYVLISLNGNYNVPYTRSSVRIGAVTQTLKEPRVRWTCIISVGKYMSISLKLARASSRAPERLVSVPHATPIRRARRVIYSEWCTGSLIPFLRYVSSYTRRGSSERVASV